jgi:hypothetical protein
VWWYKIKKPRFVLVDQASEKPLSLDPLRVEVCCGVGRLGWAKLAGTVRPSTVVVPDVLGERGPKMPLTEDQHTVGELGSGCEHKPLGVAVRPWAVWRNPDRLDTHVGQDGIEGGRELASPVADKKSELIGSIAKIHHEVADLLGGPSTVRVRGRAEDVDIAAADLQDKNT